jgi:hypothetical protein
LAVPAATPVTTPLVFTVPTAVLLLLQAPPVVVVVSVVVVVGQTVLAPDNAAGAVRTEAVIVLENTGFATRQVWLLSILQEIVLPLVSVLLE